MSVFNHLSQISTLRVTHGRQAKVIDDYRFALAQRVHKLGIGAIGLGYRKIVEEARCPTDFSIARM